MILSESEWDGSKNWLILRESLEQPRLEHLFSPGKKRLFACACVRRNWDLVPQGALRESVLTAERFVIGQATGDELAEANKAAMTANQQKFRHKKTRQAVLESALVSRADIDEACGAFSSLKDDGDKAALFRSLIEYPPRYLAMKTSLPLSCVRCGCQEVGFKDDHGANCRWCFREMRYAWLTSQVIDSARESYLQREEDGSLIPLNLQKLSDALEEASCTDALILNQLRDKGVKRYRGLWSLDFCLGVR